MKRTVSFTIQYTFQYFQRVARSVFLIETAINRRPTLKLVHYNYMIQNVTGY